MFITGNGFQAYCEQSFGVDPYILKGPGQSAQPNWFFSEIDQAENAAKHWVAQGKKDIILITHNGDTPVTENLVKRVRSIITIKHWFGQNVECQMEGVTAIPIGIANPKWEHGNTDELKKAMQTSHVKSRLVYAAYEPKNHPERLQCLVKTGVDLKPRMSFPSYLHDVGKHLFVISPRGNGLDCHRHWEALYMRAIPITLKSSITHDHPDIPFLALDSWDDYKQLNLGIGLYEKVWNGFDVNKLQIERYVTERMISIIKDL